MGAGLGKALSAACFSNDVLLLALKAGETDVVAEVNGAFARRTCRMHAGHSRHMLACWLGRLLNWSFALQHLEAHPNAATGSLSVRDGNSAFHVSAGERLVAAMPCCSHRSQLVVHNPGPLPPGLCIPHMFHAS